MPAGIPARVPEDGLTTRQRRQRPLLIIHTGDGKGKSTAAFGLALRGWNQGWSVGVFQFVKSAKWRIGEQTALESLAELHGATGRGGCIEWHKMGSGWSWSRRAGTDDDHAAAAAEGWQEIKRRLAEEKHTLYVLDEFTYPINWGWIRPRRRDQHLGVSQRLPARDHHRSAGGSEAHRGGPAGHGNDQDQAPLRRRPEGPARDRVVIDPESPRSATELPRLVIAAPGSGHGKTTVATGLMGALSATGLKVAGFKVGPDYIDPGYHTLATGRLGRNLDPYLCGENQIAPLLLHGAQTPEPADVAVIEGVMGLFDGQIGGEGFASTAHVATLIQAPVIMVLDISHTSRTAAAIVHGLNTFDPNVRLSGVILNKAGSERHAREIVEALQATGLEVLGVLPRDAGIEIPSRHLGLVPAAERAEAAEAVAQLARRISDHVSLNSIMSIARSAPPAGGRGLVCGSPRTPSVRCAASGRGRGGPGLHIPLRRDRRVAPRRRLRSRDLRPDVGYAASGRNGRALFGRRVS